MKSELTKLRRPASWLLLMFVLLVGVGTVGWAQAADADQWAVVSDGLADMDTAEGVDGLCNALQVTDDKCVAQVEEERASLRRLGDELIREQPYAAALQSSTAAPGVAAGLMASWIGIIAISMIAAVHVTSEWQYGTARVLLSGRQSLLRFLVVKTASVFVMALVLFAGLAVALAALGPLLKRLYMVGPPNPTFDNLAFSVTHSISAIAVIAFVAFFSTAVAMVVRNQLAVISLVTGMILFATYLATWPALVSWTPTYWIASVMNFDASGSLRDHVWPTTFPVGGSDPVAYQPILGYVGISLLAMVSLVLAYFWSRKAEVR